MITRALKLTVCGLLLAVIFVSARLGDELDSGGEANSVKKEDWIVELEKQLEIALETEATGRKESAQYQSTRTQGVSSPFKANRQLSKHHHSTTHGDDPEKELDVHSNITVDTEVEESEEIERVRVMELEERVVNFLETEHPDMLIELQAKETAFMAAKRELQEFIGMVVGMVDAADQPCKPKEVEEDVVDAIMSAAEDYDGRQRQLEFFSDLDDLDEEEDEEIWVRRLNETGANETSRASGNETSTGNGTSLDDLDDAGEEEAEDESLGLFSFFGFGGDASEDGG